MRQSAEAGRWLKGSKPGTPQSANEHWQLLPKRQGKTYGWDSGMAEFDIRDMRQARAVVGTKVPKGFQRMVYMSHSINLRKGIAMEQSVYHIQMAEDS